MKNPRRYNVLFSLLVTPFLLLLLASCTTVNEQASSLPEHFVAVQSPVPLVTSITDSSPPDYTLAQETDDQDVMVETEDTAEQEIKALERLGKWEPGTPTDQTLLGDTLFDFPVTVNRQVQYYLDLFQNDQRDTFARWLVRSGRYLPMIQAHFAEAGLPLDLAYLPMIESGYILTARSPANAVGPWQFMEGTARDFDLVIDRYIDERRDPEKSTRAAASYLAALHKEFGCWLLAVAAYNAGPNKIKGALEKQGVDNFWNLAEGTEICSETKRYVPKLIAAIIIAKNPQRFGFTNITYQYPISYETVAVPAWTNLKAVAVACGQDESTLNEFNRELRKGITPPDQKTYLLKVPAGARNLVAKNLERVHPSVTIDFATHVVAEGETINKICNQYQVSKTSLLKANNIRTGKLSAGLRLRIPVQNVTYRLLPEGQGGTDHIAARNASGGVAVHAIQKGDTLSALARRYNVTVEQICSWNRLDKASQLNIGQQVTIFASTAAADEMAKHPVGKDEEKPPLMVQGKKTVVSAPSPASAQAVASSAPAPTVKYDAEYMVREGDTLWSIAKKFNTTPDEIRKLNRMKDDGLQPGRTLILKAGPRNNIGG